MRTRTVWLALPLLLAATSARAKGPASDVVVHEWGTFLSMSGSDGVALDGMYHEEHALPAFVHARGTDQLRLRSILTKGETPVIYFYTKSEQNARVEVKFPRGIWTQWYPQSGLVLPRLNATPVDAAGPPRDGRIVWNVGIVPAGTTGPNPPPPPTSADALWNFAREVDAAYVRTYNPVKPGRDVETERFLFYRGLGTAPLPLRMSADAGGTLTADAAGPGVTAVYVLRVKGGRGAYAYRTGLAPGQTARGVIPSMDGARPLARFDDGLADHLAARLVEAGLYPKEARAMVSTWRASYFGTEGVRVLFVLPQKWTDEFIPLTINPAPKSITRVMVGRLEMLTPARERLAEAALSDLASPDAAKRAVAFELLRAQGRYVEPVVRRVLRTTQDESLRARCRRLLATDFVTDLRAALATPAAVNPVPAVMVLNEEPVHIRARLAGLLREVGLDAEAKAEGRAALAGLDKRTPVPPNVCEARHDLRAYGLALEGVGDDRQAADRYGRLVDLAAVAVRNRDCRKCHEQAGADVAIRLPDWWAGGSYARTVGRGGGLDRGVAALEAAPRSDATRLRLAYLYRAAGRSHDAEAIWASLGAGRVPLAMEGSGTGTGPIPAAGRRD